MSEEKPNRNDYKPDYGNDPAMLKGALNDAQEAIGHLQSRIAELEEEVAMLRLAFSIIEESKKGTSDKKKGGK